jgi:hypothetical protein
VHQLVPVCVYPMNSHKWSVSASDEQVDQYTVDALTDWKSQCSANVRSKAVVTVHEHSTFVNLLVDPIFISSHAPVIPSKQSSSSLSLENILGVRTRSANFCDDT